MKKVTVSKHRVSREYLSNPHANTDLESRLKKSNCTNYNGNVKIQDLGNGYAKIIPKR